MKPLLGKEAAEDKWDIVPNFGSDGLEPPGTGGVLGRAFSRTVFSKEMLTQVKDMKHCWSAGCCGGVTPNSCSTFDVRYSFKNQAIYVAIL